jgi:hypothetical protein
MKAATLTAAFCLALATSSLWAATPASTAGSQPAAHAPTAPVKAPMSATHGPASAKTKPLTKQQQRMKDCNSEAKTKALKGNARKGFMKKCLSGKS